jgi:hypothetical protein
VQGPGLQFIFVYIYFLFASIQFVCSFCQIFADVDAATGKIRIRAKFITRIKNIVIERNYLCGGSR